jgi:hypothetical protein
MANHDRQLNTITLRPIPLGRLAMCVAQHAARNMRSVKVALGPYVFVSYLGLVRLQEGGIEFRVISSSSLGRREGMGDAEHMQVTPPLDSPLVEDSHVHEAECGADMHVDM